MHNFVCLLSFVLHVEFFMTWLAHVNNCLLSRNSGNVLVVSPILCNCDEFANAFFLLLFRKFLLARTAGFVGESRVVGR